ncbi:MAG: hypothetical protein H0X30_12405 [Anaerolineae bacterium]|nr:hypothetical protein [Anaerolineae bacterium]
MSGCIRLEPIPTATPPAVQMPTIQPTPINIVTATPDYGWTDVSSIMEGVCFEAALNTAGRVFSISNATALDAFYSQIDQSQLCEDPVIRVDYPFNNGEIIVGLWSSGTGCTARHDVQSVRRDDAQKQEAIQLQFVTEGDCPYDLVQPFWIALPQSIGFNIQIDVQR